MDVLDSDVAVQETFWGRVFEAQSKHPASKKTDFPAKHEFIAWEYTHHNDEETLPRGRPADGVEVLASGAVRIHQRSALPKGLSTTRFHKGFQRRRQADIRQDEARLRREATKERLSLLHLERRRQRLGDLDKRNGFSLSTDSVYRQSTTPFHTKPKPRETGSLSEVAERAEYLLLRDSKYKFHAPAWSGENHDRRQDLLRREGLNKPKKSTLLGIGGSDLASAGAEDMFSKAIYDPAKACTLEGLVETGIPGRYTPRKVLAARRTQVASANRRDAPNDYDLLPHTREERSACDGGDATASAPQVSSSPASLGTVYRVVPNGIGAHSMLAGRGGATVAGIAPTKRLCGSRSMPILTRRGPSEGETLASPGAKVTTFPHSVSFERPTSPSGVTSATAFDDVEGGDQGAETALPKPLNNVTCTSTNLANDRSDVLGTRGTRSTACGSEMGRRDLIRSQSDVGSKGPTERLERGATEKACATHHYSSADYASPPPASSDGNSSWSRYSRSRRASPSQRRMDAQLALDLATVRSL